MVLEDYNKIKVLIDDIIGINTIQGNNLKKAIKNYFETKPKIVKLVSSQSTVKVSNSITKYRIEAKKAMEQYTKELKVDIEQLKKNGEYCGTSG